MDNEAVVFKSECGTHKMHSSTEEIADTVDRIIGLSEIPEDEIDSVRNFVLLGFIASIPWTLEKLGEKDADN